MLAQNSNTATIFIWALVLVGVVLVGFLIVSWAKKRLTRTDESLNTGFTLSDLRRLHKEGKLSADEFERAKAAITASAKAALDKKNPAKPDGGSAGGSFTDRGV